MKTIIPLFSFVFLVYLALYSDRRVSYIPSMTNVPKPRYTKEDYRDRPRDYDPSIANEIIDRISNGEMLAQICDNRDMPLPGTFLRWCDADPILEKEYIDARRRSAEVSLDEMVIHAMTSDPSLAGTRSRALKDYVQMTDPARYGPRATIRIPGEGEGDGGIDHRAEVRRKIEALAKRHAQQEPAGQSDAG